MRAIARAATMAVLPFAAVSIVPSEARAQQATGGAPGATSAPASAATTTPAAPAPPPPPPAPSPSAPAPAPSPAPASASASPSAPPSPPAPPPPPPPPSTEESTRNDETPDHDRLVGHLGVTYFDITDIPIANQLPDVGNGSAASPGPGGITSSTVSAPVIGVRYWLQRNLGIDLGVGVGLAGGSTEAVQGTTDTTVSKVSSTGFALHGGVPFAFAHGRHYSFLVIPEVTVGFASATFKPTAQAGVPVGPNQDLSGFLFDGGARIGAEIYFGFIGIPQLALQATLGVSYRRSVFKWSSGNNSASDGTNSFGTNVQADPWAIFKDAISATYYF